MDVTLHRWDDDEQILDDLSGAVREAASLAGAVAEYGRGAYAWRTVDQDLLLACLDFDPSPEPVRDLRSDAGDARVLVFTASVLSLELELMPGRVVGQVIPPGPGEIRVEAADGVTFHIEADDVGFFELPTMPHGPVRLRCDTPTGRLVTDWVRL
ncbi:MAG TPA: hypothetical protein VEC76_18635 [Streptosporangiaceae bacterium]|nr:hypothetical protein [Streptosporangiaceae bacterium]